MNLKDICNDVRDLTKASVEFINKEKKKIRSENIEIKGLNDFVTYVDRSSEELLVKGLTSILPESGFIAEENTSKRSGERYTWIIDPLDGTTNFIHGAPPFAVSIGLKYHDSIVLGVVHEISLDECFYAWEGEGAFLNDNRIFVSDNKIVKDSLIATGFPYYDYKLMRQYLSLLEYLMMHSHGIRRLGSAATDLSYVACGRYDAFYEYSLSPWDVAAGAFIVQQAGGKISDFKGGNDWLFGREIISSNHHIFNELSDIIKKFL
ncbi:MAG: inositol monophosphatase family protein [Bacteroidia bacterium]|nr:inositol monophosphatase family protein [Bacteroidia bacterium]